jgi:hypothetical protein
MVKYHFERDDGAELDVQGGVWETVLELAYQNGWVPAGTDEPRDDTWRRSFMGTASSRSMLAQRPWRRGDYFSGVGQYVTPRDASALASAVMRGLPVPQEESEPNERIRPERSVARFASGGGFVIGKRPGSGD